MSDTNEESKLLSVMFDADYLLQIRIDRKTDQILLKTI